MQKVICIGSATKDVFVSVKNTKIIDTPEDITSQKLMCFEYGAKIYAQSFRESVGGSAVNVATGLELCNVKPIAFSRVSRNETGRWILKQIAKRGIKKNYMQKSGKLQSEVSLILTDTSHDDHVIFRTGDSVELFDIQKAINKFQETAELIYIGSQKKGWEKSLDFVSEFAENKSATLALNPSSFQIKKCSKDLFKRLAKIDILFVNKDEAIELIQRAKGKSIDDVKKLGESIRESGCSTIIITDGPDGAYLFTEDESLHAPTFASNVVDTTGAGDAFASGFLSGYVKQENIADCLLWGLSNSSGVVSMTGATIGLLGEQEIRKISDKNKDKIQKL